MYALCKLYLDGVAVENGSDVAPHRESWILKR